MQYDQRGTIAVYSKCEDGTCEELIVDLYEREYEFTSDLHERELSGQKVGGIKLFEVSRAFFLQLFNVVKSQFCGYYNSGGRADPDRLAAEEKKKPVIGQETLKRAIRCELSQQELDDIISFDYRYEKGDYADFPTICDKIHAVMEGAIDVNYFTSWCVLLMRCFMDAMDTRSKKLQEVYDDIGDYFDGVAFMDSDISKEEKCRELRALLAFLKYYEHLAANIQTGSKEKFQTAGVVTCVSFAFSVQDGERVLSRVCVADEVKREVNYMMAADFDFDERINYTLLTRGEFEDLSSSLFKYSLNTSMGIEYALKKLAERRET